eukprot:TRINITY_DN13401_c0_g1_i20.p2 TRINITY_DN13401_c0_g1~~TRINITY_DN13401_c0_g1_i20.p2  ORF type:complete len:111 (-),score=15.40 TRINITY_DN13401_c0_g1_i20:734-1042(-)
MIRRPPRSTHCISSAASDVYKRQMWNSLSTGNFLNYTKAWESANVSEVLAGLLEFIDAVQLFRLWADLNFKQIYNASSQYLHELWICHIYKRIITFAGCGIE